jgi:outer membrane protein OmpA-like peptidoglycan-associated protein/tetratricopeptide (TPR) repeat protein
MAVFTRNTKLIILALFLIQFSFAQNNKVAKANQQYDRYEYINARDIYLMVVEDGYHSAEIYKRLGDTYYYNSNYGLAANWYSKLLETYPESVETEYYYRTAQSLKGINNYEESDKLMNKYVALGGEERVVEVFDTDPEYLKSLGVQPFKYVINKISTNTKFSDFGPSYYKDRIVFSSSTKDLSNFKTHNWNNLPYLDLFSADMDENGKFSNAEPLSGEINTVYHESSTSFSKDGRTVYFTRNNYSGGKEGRDADRTMRLKLYRAHRDIDGDWVAVVELPFNADEYSIAHPALSRDEKRLYFASDMPGTYGRSDLWYVDIYGNNVYGSPVNLGPIINTKARETFPFISENNNLYFSSDGHGGLGGLDIFITPLDEDYEHGPLTNFGAPINSKTDDFGFITKESEGSGFYTSNVDGGRGSIDDEIFRFVEECVMTFNVSVIDIDNQEVIANAEVSILNENYQLIEKVNVGEGAAHVFTVACDEKYIILGAKKNYFPGEKVVESPDEGGVVDLILELKHKEICPPNDLGCRLSLQPIYFDYDKSDVRADAEVELAKILAALRKYTELVIHIESHTDSRGRDGYNEKLSERRATSTLNWFVEHGISQVRLSAKGYGESQLVNHCWNDQVCTEEEHQLNRRSMFIIQDVESISTFKEP